MGLADIKTKPVTPKYTENFDRVFVQGEIKEVSVSCGVTVEEAAAAVDALKTHPGIKGVKARKALKRMLHKLKKSRKKSKRISYR